MADARPSNDRPAHGWRRHGVNEPTKPLDTGLTPRAAQRRRTLLLLATGFVIVVAAIVGWFMLPRGFADPYFLTIPITEYGSDAHLPSNAFATEDSKALRDHFLKDLNQKDYNFQEGHLFKQRLAILGEQPQPIVVHLRAHARTRGERVYLLPGDYKPDAPEQTWQPLEDVLNAMRQSPNKRRLLLLDLMRPLADPFRGILFDDVAAKVDALVKRELAKEEEPLWVLCACGPEQVSLVSEELGLSVFGHYLNEGLQGRADGWGQGNKSDSIITVKELASFVEDHVRHWARRNRGVDQVPVLHAKGSDFELVSLVRRLPPRRERPDPKTYPAWLHKAWQDRDDAWWEGDAQTLAPHALRQYEAALLRAEQRWRSDVLTTEQIGKIQENLSNDLRRLEKQLDAVRPLEKQLEAERRPPPEPSLAWARKRGKAPDTSLFNEINSLAGRKRKVSSAAKPEEADKELLKAWEDVLKRCKDRPFHLGQALVDAAETTATPEVVHFLGEKAATSGAALQYAEVRALQRLNEWLEKIRQKRAEHFTGMPPLLLKAAMHCIIHAEEAAACAPHVLPWIEKEFNDSAAKWRKGLDLVAQKGPSGRGEATDLVKAAANRFHELSVAAARLEQAHDDLDQALVTLPQVLPYLLARRGPDPVARRSWDELVEGILDLDGKLADRQWQRATDLAFAAGGLVRHYRNLRRPLSEANFQQLQVQLKEDPVALLAELESLLASPWLEADVRAEVWTKAHELARELQEVTEKIEKVEDRRSFEAPDRGGPQLKERERAALRAGLMLDLLRVARIEDAGPRKEDVKAIAADADSTVWLERGEKLRVWQREQIARQLQATESSVEAADRIHRVLPLSDRDVSSDNSTDRQRSDNPTGHRRRAAERSYWDWLEGWHKQQGSGP